ncbi:MAG TPA: ABC-F family ATP-binding cassette domain-containing protein [Lactobacillaceae bacterium]|jgi:ATPase subunit of ABC transporter with duplicated ATPase domains
MNRISINQVSQRYAGQEILNHVTFSVNEHERIGVVGRNGSGKTTLLKLLARQEQPASGTIAWSKETIIGYTQQNLKVSQPTVMSFLQQAFAELVPIQNQLQHFEEQMSNGKTLTEQELTRYGTLLDDFQMRGGYEIDVAIQQVTGGLKITSLLQRSWTDLSGGERTKVALAQVLLRQSNLLILDEPTNHLDLSTIDWLIQFIRQYAGTVLVVSHDRHFLDVMVTRIIEVEDGAVHDYLGDYTYFVAEKQRRLMDEFQNYKDQQVKIKKMRQSIHQLKEWAHVYSNEKFASRARSMQKALDRLVVIKRPKLTNKSLRMDFNNVQRSSNTIFKLTDVRYAVAERELFRQVDLTIKYGQKVAILGDNGLGKSTLIKLMLGETMPDQGTVYRGERLEIGYLSQFVTELPLNKTVLEAFLAVVPMEVGEARHVLAEFLFFQEDVYKLVGALSGGEKKRLRWAQLVSLQYNVLILDEPTNDLDIASIEVLEDTLDKYDGTVIVVSHDRYFVEKHFDRRFILADQTLTEQFS